MIFISIQDQRRQLAVLQGDPPVAVRRCQGQCRCSANTVEYLTVASFFWWRLVDLVITSAPDRI
jgi:hypothetical protein